MRWENRKPTSGEIIRTPIGNFYHYGIFKSDNEVIQFGKNPLIKSTDSNLLCVCITSMQDFLFGNELQVLNSFDNNFYNTEKTLKNALSRLGEKGYNIIHNNCEHFVNECAFNKKQCFQVDDIRSMFKEMCTTDLYIAKIPESSIQVIVPKERQTLIDKTSNIKLKRQRFFVWKLLEIALLQSYGLNINNINFSVDKNGKWYCSECFFSLSHCDDAVAVAVSKKPVGVDIENVNYNFNKGFAEKILTDNELKEYNTKNDKDKLLYLLKCWCAKESIFKASDKDTFHPSEIEYKTNTKIDIINVNNDSFCYSVCSCNTNFINIYNNINL